MMPSCVFRLPVPVHLPLSLHYIITRWRKMSIMKLIVVVLMVVRNTSGHCTLEINLVYKIQLMFEWQAHVCTRSCCIGILKHFLPSPHLVVSPPQPTPCGESSPASVTHASSHQIIMLRATWKNRNYVVTRSSGHSDMVKFGQCRAIN